MAELAVVVTARHLLVRLPVRTDHPRPIVALTEAKQARSGCAESRDAVTCDELPDINLEDILLACFPTYRSI